MKKETIFKKKTISRLKWVMSIEPRRGTDTGMPDIIALTSTGLLPIELKAATISNGRLQGFDLRPDQIGWHKRFSANGGFSIVLILVGEKTLCQAFWLDGKSLSEYRHYGIGLRPFNIEDPQSEIDEIHLNSQIPF